MKRICKNDWNINTFMKYVNNDAIKILKMKKMKEKQAFTIVFSLFFCFFLHTIVDIVLNLPQTENIKNISVDFVLSEWRFYLNLKIFVLLTTNLKFSWNVPI